VIVTFLFALISINCRSASGCLTSLLDLHDRLHEMSNVSNGTNPALAKNDFFSLTGKIMKTKEEYQNPTSIYLGWFDFPEGRNFQHCGGESILSNHGFSIIDNITLEEFDQSLPALDQSSIKWFAEILDVSEEEIGNVKIGMGAVLGNYGNDKTCGFEGAQKGPNGERAYAVEYALFYRNGTFPYSNCDHFDYPGDDGLDEYHDYKSYWGDGKGYDCHEWGSMNERKRLREKKCKCKMMTEGYLSKIPQGFSCGKAKYVERGFDEFIPVDCSEVVLQVSNPKSCKHNPELGDDCMNQPNWT